MSEGRTVVFVAQSGFYPFPPVVRTYAPRGQTPVLTGYATRDHLSAICGVSLDGELLRFHVQNGSFKGADVVRFLKDLLRQVPGKLTVIWDGAPIHREKPSASSWLGVPGGGCTWNGCRVMRRS